MDKKAVIAKYFQKIAQLNLDNTEYRKRVDELIMFLLETDHVSQDSTTQTLLENQKQTSRAQIVSRKDSIVAGVEEVGHLLKTQTSLKFAIIHPDGAHIKAGEPMLSLSGLTTEILAYERVVLNILQRLSGIATTTHTLVSTINSLTVPNETYVAATRKTNWGLLDKKAVGIGGGLTHRLSLSDGILVKDNHLLLLQKQFGSNSEEEVVSKVLDILLGKVKNTLLEIEVEKKESITVLIEKFLSIKTDNVLGILLDNFSPKEATEIIKELNKSYDLSNIISEASGGITPENIAQWAQTRVDIISLGALTHSSIAADISLDLI